MKRVKHKNINQRVQPVWIHSRIHLRMAPKERDYVTLATVRELLTHSCHALQLIGPYGPMVKGAGIHIQIVI